MILVNKICDHWCHFSYMYTLCNYCPHVSHTSAIIVVRCNLWGLIMLSCDLTFTMINQHTCTSGIYTKVSQLLPSLCAIMEFHSWHKLFISTFQVLKMTGQEKTICQHRILTGRKMHITWLKVSADSKNHNTNSLHQPLLHTFMYHTVIFVTFRNY